MLPVCNSGGTSGASSGGGGTMPETARPRLEIASSGGRLSSGGGASATTPETIRMRGISLAGMLYAIEKVGGRTALDGKSIRCVEDEFFVPAQEASGRSSFADQIRLGPTFTGPPTRFVSYLNASSFLGAVDALQQYEEQHPHAGPFFYSFFPFTSAWNCSVYEHSPESWVYFFASLASSIGWTLFILPTGGALPNDPRKSTMSAWCLFEIASTLRGGGGRCEIIRVPGDEAAWRQAAEKLIAGVNAETSRARDEKVHSILHRLFREELGGYAAVTEKIRVVLRVALEGAQLGARGEGEGAASGAGDEPSE